MVFNEDGTFNSRWEGAGSFNTQWDAPLGNDLNFSGFEIHHQDNCMIACNPTKRTAFFHNRYLTDENSHLDLSTAAAGVDFTEVDEAVPNGKGPVFFNKQTGYGRYVRCSKRGLDSIAKIIETVDFRNDVEILDTGHSFEVMDWTTGRFWHFNQYHDRWPTDGKCTTDKLTNFQNQHFQKSMLPSKFMVDPFWFTAWYGGVMYRSGRLMLWNQNTEWVGEIGHYEFTKPCIKDHTADWNSISGLAKFDFKRVDKYFSLGHYGHLVHPNVWSPRS